MEGRRRARKRSPGIGEEYEAEEGKESNMGKDEGIDWKRRRRLWMAL